MTAFVLWLTALSHLWSASAAPAARPELFPGEQRFAGCALHLPLTYLTKDMPAALHTARAYQNQELVLVSYHPETHQASFQRVYVYAFTNKAGKEIIYQETAAEHSRPSHLRKYLFTRFHPQTERYYLARCFDETLAATPTLRAQLTEQ